ncbi:stage II sporulation protein M [bacterium]|nr:stage II sporulation protein M [bacterium]
MDRRRIIIFLKRYFLYLYLRTLIPYILGAIVIFIVGIFLGYYFAEFYPDQAKELILIIRQTYEPLLHQNKILQTLSIFLKNGLSSLFVILSGLLFGIFPLIALLNNGEILGILANFSLKQASFSYFLTGIIPHGILEIPCFLIFSAIGLKIGWTVIRKIFNKEVSIVKELNLGLTLFIRLLIILFFSALIEVFITSNLLF